VTAVFAIAAVGAVNSYAGGSCSKSASAASAEDMAKCKANAEQVAAKVTTDAHKCCQNAVNAALASYMQACKTSKASSGSCSSTKTATAQASSSDLSECCQDKVAAFELALAKSYTVASAGTYSCSSKKTSTETAGVVSSGCGSSATKTSLAAIPLDTGKSFELTGSLACGHCDLKTTDGCQAVFQTADGKAYLLKESKLVEKMRKEENEKGYKIVTTVRDLDGTKVLEVDKVKPL
jgi:hypothetical protein